MKKLLGVSAGIAVTLLLTLNLWGNAWWQMAIAIIAGTLIGLLIAHPITNGRGFLTAIAKSLSFTANYFWPIILKLQKVGAKKIETEQYTAERFNNKIASTLQFFCIFSMILMFAVILYLAHIHYNEDKPWVIIVFMIGFVLLIIFPLGVLTDCTGLSNWAKTISEERQIQIWGQKIISNRFEFYPKTEEEFRQAIWQSFLTSAKTKMRIYFMRLFQTNINYCYGHTICHCRNSGLPFCLLIFPTPRNKQRPEQLVNYTWNYYRRAHRHLAGFLVLGIWIWLKLCPGHRSTTAKGGKVLSRL